MPAADPAMVTRDPGPTVIAFDCSGTLVPWGEVLLREIDTTVAAHGASHASACAILDRVSAHGRRLTAERPHRLYKDILRSTFAAALGDRGLTSSADEIEQIAALP